MPSPSKCLFCVSRFVSIMTPIRVVTLWGCHMSFVTGKSEFEPFEPFEPNFYLWFIYGNKYIRNKIYATI